MQRAFVTGGSGFVGGVLITALRERGCDVKTLVRSEAAASSVAEKGATPILGNLDDCEALRRGAEGCDVVFHSAAIIAGTGSDQDVYRANVTGTENVLEAASSAGVARFVHVSTEAVLADGAPIIRADETRPRPRRRVGIYAITKGLAEERVIAANGSGLATVICRPRLIWGEGDTSVLPFFAYTVKKGLFHWIGDGRYLTSTCHVRNVAHGLMLAAEKGRPGGIYFLTDGEPVEFRTFLTSLLATRGLVPGDRSTPRPLAVFLSHFGRFVERVFNRPRSPLLARNMFCLLGQEVTLDDSLARSELGYVEIVSRSEGLRELEEGASRE